MPSVSLEQLSADLDGIPADRLNDVQGLTGLLLARSEERRVGKEVVGCVDLGGRRIIRSEEHTSELQSP